MDVHEEDVVGVLRKALSEEDTTELVAHLENATTVQTLFDFVANDDAITTLKSLFSVENAATMMVLIDPVGRLLLRVWFLLYEEDMEGYIASMDSRSDLLRRKEDFLDAILDFFRNTALLVMGKPLSADVSASSIQVTMDQANIYAAPLLALLTLYHQASLSLDGYVQALTGYPASDSDVETAQRRSVYLSPLVQKVLDILFEDVYLLPERARDCLSFIENHSVGLGTAFLHVILKKMDWNVKYNVETGEATDHNTIIQPRNALLQPLSKDDKPLFGLDATSNLDPTQAALQNTHRINIEQFCHDFLDTVLMPIVRHSIYLGERLLALQHVICLVQHPLLSSLLGARVQELMELLFVVLSQVHPRQSGTLLSFLHDTLLPYPSHITLTVIPCICCLVFGWLLGKKARIDTVLSNKCLLP